ncbi:hypothetical protein [Streptacidiphilus anmyonensis]|uniref:hypothetical protein n=1 Tax=Streptacidiphilus anmyonensis TaxID=405782 RepID=UPI0005A67B0A|nr:hypothetical protein [Streptacidiphilus anmyonensis]
MSRPDPLPSSRTKPYTFTFAVPEGASKEEVDGLFLAAVAKAAHKRGMNLEMTIDHDGTAGPTAPRPLPPAWTPEHTRPPGLPPDPSTCTTVAEFNEKLRLLHTWAGGPAYREIARRTADLGCALSKSGIGRILAADATRPPGADHLVALVRAYGVTETECRDWLAALERLKAPTARVDEPGGPDDTCDGRRESTPAPKLVLTGTAAALTLPHLMVAAPLALPALAVLLDDQDATHNATPPGPAHPDGQPAGRSRQEDTEPERQVLSGRVLTRAEVEAAADQMLADHRARADRGPTRPERGKRAHEVAAFLRHVRGEFRTELDKELGSNGEVAPRQEFTVSVTADGYRLSATGAIAVGALAGTVLGVLLGDAIAGRRPGTHPRTPLSRTA